jgi:hypothetical protein
MKVPDSFTEDTSTILIPVSSQLQNADKCLAPIVGVTHIDNSDKESTFGTINFPSEAVGVIFDITIVLVNGESVSAYVYSRFFVNFRDATSSTTVPSSNSV